MPNRLSPNSAAFRVWSAACASASAALRCWSDARNEPKSGPTGTVCTGVGATMSPNTAGAAAPGWMPGCCVIGSGERARDDVAAAGVGAVSIDFTLPDLVDALAAGPLPVAAEVLPALRDRLDAKDAGGVAAIAPAYLPLVEAAGPFDAALARLRALDEGGALATRLDGVAAVRASLGDRVAATLDPTERHGFEYQSWLGFSLFATDTTRELGRGGTYAIVHADGREEPATGFSLYADALLGRAAPERRRLFVPLGTDPAEPARLRAEGWVTVAQLDAADTPEAQLATHCWVAGEARPL